MALPLGKLTILVGAGIVGSVLAKEGRGSNVSDFFSGALKIVYRQLSSGGSATPNAKPKNNATLLEQVHSLREELQLLASNRPITIVTSTSSGSGRYSIIIVVVVVGYGYVWWKGWKLSDMMFATRRSLSDACGSVSKQLEKVYASISAAKRHLSSRIDSVDCKVDECADNTATTRDEVSKLRGDVRMMGTDVQSVHHVVRSLENKISSIEDKQGQTIGHLGTLINFARSYQNRRTVDQIEGASTSSSKPALDMPQLTPSRAGSLPSNLLVEPPSPSTSSGPVKHWKQGAVSDSGLRLHEASNEVTSSSQSSPQVPKAIHASEVTGDGSSSRGLFGLKTPAMGASLVRRTFSASMSFKA